MNTLSDTKITSRSNPKTSNRPSNESKANAVSTHQNASTAPSIENQAVQSVLGQTPAPTGLHHIESIMDKAGQFTPTVLSTVIYLRYAFN